MNTEEISIAIETSCRAGGIALGCGNRIVQTVTFPAASRHATSLVQNLKALLESHHLSAGDVNHVYVSAGPGSFTGIRVGITVARTLAQAVASLRCVAVPTAQAVAWNARLLGWTNLAVIADARGGEIHATIFTRSGEAIISAGEPTISTAEQFLAGAPTPLLLTGEGLAYHDLTTRHDTLTDDSLHLPTPEGVWHVARKLAQQNQFTDYHNLLPIYTRDTVGS